MKTTLSLALSLFICTTAYSQNTWIVDQSGAGDFTEIQLAIDSLSVVDGDEVVVKDGTYFEHINFNQKEILLRSENGAATTIIDGGGSGDVVSIINGEQAPTELRGFTVTNGGSGVHSFNYSDALISECVISSNNSSGVYISDNAKLGIYNSAINNNTSAGRRGGGIYAINASLVMQATEFTGNYFDQAYHSSAYGGAIHLDNVDAAITDCIFNANRVHGSYSNRDGYGGAIFTQNYSNLSIANSIFEDNMATHDGAASSRGGAIHSGTACNLTVVDTAFTNCSADSLGGAIYSNGTLEVVNCFFSNNSAAVEGSAIECYHEGVATISNVTIVNANTGLNAVNTYSPSQLTNSIIRGSNTSIDCPTTYSCIEAGKAGIGNFSVDPMFETGPQGDYYLSQTSSGQAADSPCIDAGDPNSVLIIGTTRTDELDDTGIVDIGYHYNGDNYDPNNAPVAVNDTASTIANSDVVISVLLNDSDADGDTLSVVSITTPLNGTATLNGDDVTYSPLLDWSGIDTFTYDVSDGNGGVSTATVTVTVDAPPTLNITPIIPGGIVNVTITGSAPRGTFILCWSFNGPGPTTIGGTNLNLSLSPPIRTAAPFMLDANGDGAMNPVNVPNWLTPGTGMWFQGAVIDIAGGSGVTLSNALDMVVQ